MPLFKVFPGFFRSQKSTLDQVNEQVAENNVEGEGETPAEPQEAAEGEGAKDEGEGNDAEGEEENYDPDDRSVYVRNVDYSADPASLKEHFQE